MAEQLSSEQAAALRTAMVQTWNLPIHVQKYLEYEAALAELFEGATELILAALALRQDEEVLEIAAGSGLMTFEMAEQVGPMGKVLATDLSVEFIEHIERGAQNRGMAYVSAVVQDAHDLSDHALYDAAAARFGVMYFADPVQALKAIRLALRPGGRFAAVVWTDPAQPLFGSTFGVLPRYVQLPTPLPGGPSPFRYAEKASASADLQAAGFIGVTESTHTYQARWPLGAAELWDFFSGALAGPLAQLDLSKRSELDAEVITAFEGFKSGDALVFPIAVHLVRGVAPGTPRTPSP